MIDLAELKAVFAGYQAYFPKHWHDERYKWEAIQHFQNHWNVDAIDFGAMFKEATDKTYNLLTTGYAYPRAMILEFAKADQEATRQMFRSLYDETLDLADRVENFQSAAETLREKYNDGTWKNHYQNTNTISTYLWLRYPDKYYIYRYSISRDVSNALHFTTPPKRDGSVDSMLKSYQLYDEVRDALSKNSAITQMIRDAMETTPSGAYWPDLQWRTATIDVGFYLSRFYKQKAIQDTVEPAQVSSVSASAETVTPGRQYWWLVANPKIWSYTNLKVGEEQFYTLYNENGNKRRIFQNFLDAKAGDLVIGYEATPIKKIVALAKITQGSNGKVLYFEKTEGLATPIEYSALKDCPELEQMEFFVQSNGSLFKLTEGEYNFLMDLIREENPPTSTFACEDYTKSDFLSEVYLQEQRYDVLVSLLRHKKNVILQGAPGVGKTFAAKRLAYSMMGKRDDSRIEFVQFHQNYSYEDFMLGYRPDGSGFKLTEGVFYRFCQKAANDPNREYFFLIDEINRGNMSKIFGELLMLIENGHRDEKVTLAYNGLSFYVPANLYLLGMMNTADRSLAMMDYALRRRFSFFEMEPAFHSEGFQEYQTNLANETFAALIEQVKVLNGEILEDPSLGRGFRIGHSYFCLNDPTDCTVDWMRSVVEFDILPMLAEYWFDEPKKLQRWEENLRGVFHDD